MLASLLLGLKPFSDHVGAVPTSTGLLVDLVSPTHVLSNASQFDASLAASWTPSAKANWYFPDSVTCPYANFFSPAASVETYSLDMMKQLALAGTQIKDAAASLYIGKFCSILGYPADRLRS